MAMYLKDIKEANLMSKSLLDRKTMKGWTPAFKDKISIS